MTDLPKAELIRKPDRFYGDPVEKFEAMSKAKHDGPIDIAHFRMWCSIAAKEIAWARQGGK